MICPVLDAVGKGAEASEKAKCYRKPGYIHVQGTPVQLLIGAWTANKDCKK
jgi:hypothetical protein